MMLLRETGFTFRGVHSRRDMGLIYAEKDGHVAIPRPQWNTYEIAGVSGTVMFPGETYRPINFDGTLYPARERASQQEAQTLLREVQAWLTGGRGALVFDYEPQKYYEAELGNECKWSLKNWFGGELSVRFTAQPFARSVQSDASTQRVMAPGVTMYLTAHTARPAPAEIEISVTGQTAVVTGVNIGNGKIVLTGLEMIYMDTLVISCEPPVGATIDQGGGPENAMQHATAFSQILMHNGANSVPVAVTYAGDAMGISVTLRCRGVW